MLGSKLISKAFISIKSSLSSIYYLLTNFPEWYNRNITNFKNYLIDFKNRLSNLSETNLELGIYHLHQNNLNDAWIRFKLIDKFLNPNDQTANYWLGWTYYLKNNIPKAKDHLQKAGQEDLVGLLSFLNNIEIATEIPEAIWSEYRDIIAEYYPMNFHSSKIHLPLTFAEILKNQIGKDLPDHYTIVELGSNMGMLGSEITKRLPDKINYIGIEPSPMMIELMNIYYPQEKIYDQLLCTSVNEFLSQDHLSKYQIIVSFDGLSSAQNLKDYFQKIYEILSQNGIFAFTFKGANNNVFSLKNKQFNYNMQKLLGELEQAGLTILYQNEFLLEIHNKYIIVVAKKLMDKS